MRVVVALALAACTSRGAATGAGSGSHQGSGQGSAVASVPLRARPAQLAQITLKALGIT